jgi:hypothetical protein
MKLFTFLFKAMKETHEQCKTKIDFDEFRSRTTIITLSILWTNKKPFTIALLLFDVFAHPIIGCAFSFLASFSISRHTSPSRYRYR